MNPTTEIQREIFLTYLSEHNFDDETIDRCIGFYLYQKIKLNENYSELISMIDPPKCPKDKNPCGYEEIIDSYVECLMHDFEIKELKDEYL